MTEDERKGLDQIEGGIELLRNAIVKGDPVRELEFRVRDILTDIRSIRQHGRVLPPPQYGGRQWEA